ncbi:hypothetical protein T07_3742 [Trichinella nelsoni]|uniref:Uncharacterized protein n=1 Tax=Trichinella nelsoni TaxID=6336 RepID=A0A0V0SM59_9BILA|nr:hypothetical protein T07_3742 [Trichinella nelsoni]
MGQWATRYIASRFNLLRCCMLSAMSAENPVSQKCIEEKGTNIRYSACDFTKKLRHKDVEFRFHGSFLKIMWEMFDDHYPRMDFSQVYRSGVEFPRHENSGKTHLVGL